MENKSAATSIHVVTRDDFTESIVVFCLVAVFLETAYRIASIDHEFWWQGGHSFLLSFGLCLMTQLMQIKDSTVEKSVLFRSLLSILHGMDGMAALLIGLSIYFRSIVGLWIGLIIITKIFLIHVLNRMILGKKTDGGILAECTQTTKSFLHHVSSFLFIQEPTEIIITTVWRFVSMSGHALLVLRGKVSSITVYRLNWMVAILRIIILLGLFVGCLYDKTLRCSFGRSAVGHITYMMVRFGPVFRSGSMYLDAKEKEAWSEVSECGKVCRLVTGQPNMFMALELCLLLATSTLFGIMRLSMLVDDVTTALQQCPNNGLLCHGQTWWLSVMQNLSHNYESGHRIERM